MTKSEIFKAAWVNVKTNGVSLSVALKAAWAASKAPKLAINKEVEAFILKGTILDEVTLDKYILLLSMSNWNYKVYRDNTIYLKKGKEQLTVNISNEEVETLRQGIAAYNVGRSESRQIDLMF